MKQSVIVVDIMKSICDSIPVNFMHGSATEIESNLIEITKMQGLEDPVVTKKYPLICLFQDFPEEVGKTDYYGIVTMPVIIIATITDNKFKAPKRYEETFRPILYPLYEKFKKAIARSRAIVETDPTLLPHTKWDRLYWGTKPAGQGLNDYVDAIEIQNLKLTFQQFC